MFSPFRPTSPKVLRRVAHLAGEEVNAAGCSQLIEPAQVVQLPIKQEGLTSTRTRLTSAVYFPE
jgi:hypothetical protein